MEKQGRILKKMGPLDWSQKTILVVDDDEFMRYNLTRYLTSEGYHVRAIDDGFQALQDCLASVPDLIISDIHMPELDGVTLLRGLRNRPETRDIPVIFISAFTTVEIMDEARKLGAEFFLDKPFPNEKLRALIEMILTRRRQKKRNAGTEWTE